MSQQKEAKKDSLVEVSGVIMTSDSLLKIPGVTVRIIGSNRGLVANSDGVFSIVAHREDTVAFSVVGFKTQKINIPSDFKGHFMGVAVFLNQDTTYLPPMVVHSYPSKEEFEEAFLHWNIPRNLYDLANSNVAVDKLESAKEFTPPDGGEGVQQTFNHRYQHMRSKGQMPTMNIFNPLAWAEFIKSIKDGDYKSDK